MVSPVGDDFFVGATFGRPHGLYKFKPCRSQKRAVEGASPYSFFGQNRSARCWGTTMVSYAHSSFLIPNSSFLTPHFSFECRFPLHIVSRGLLLPFLPLYFAVLCNFTIIFGCFNVKNPLSCSILLQTLFSLSKQ